MISGRAKFLIILASLAIAGAGAIYIIVSKQAPSASHAGARKTPAGSDFTHPPGTALKPADLRKMPVDPASKREGDIPDDITPDQARALLEDFFKKTPNMNERKAFGPAVIRKLCKAGYSEEAWTVIPEDRSIIRSAMLQDYFAHAELPPRNLLMKIGEMNSELSEIFRGYLSRYSPAELAAMLSSPDLRNLVDRMGPERAGELQLDRNAAEILGKGLGPDPAANATVIVAADELRAKGLLSTARYMDLMVRDGTQDAFQKWDKVRMIDPGTGDEGDEILSARKEIIIGMSDKNPDGIIDLLLKSPSTGKERNLGNAVGHLLYRDPKTATEWYDQNLSKLDPQDRDLVETAYFEAILDRADVDRAKAWISRITDPSAKERASARLAELMEQKRRYDEEHGKKNAE